METSLEVTHPGQSIFASSPSETVKHATEIANALAPIIEKQQMFSIIQGKKHPKVEAWLTLGAILGVLPREKSVREHEDGSYEAEVELVNTQGRVVAGASALCGVDEKRWAQAERYARRSMAVTRATGKAYRLAFSWIIQLAGYQPTPAEEMPDSHDYAPQYTQKAEAEGFNPQDRGHQDWLMKQLKAQKVPEEKWDDVAKALTGKPHTALAESIRIGTGQKK